MQWIRWNPALQKVWNRSGKPTKLEQGWLITNTRFSEDAINYAKCVNLQLMSWDYPKGNGISHNIDKFGLYPITALSILKKHEKKKLIDEDIVLIKELLESSHILNDLQIPRSRIQKIENLIKNICRL
jgi:hypothetical protein